MCLRPVSQHFLFTKSPLQKAVKLTCCAARQTTRDKYLGCDFLLENLLQSRTEKPGLDFDVLVKIQMEEHVTAFFAWTSGQRCPHSLVARQHTNADSAARFTQVNPDSGAQMQLIMACHAQSHSRTFVLRSSTLTKTLSARWHAHLSSCEVCCKTRCYVGCLVKLVVLRTSYALDSWERSIGLCTLRYNNLAVCWFKCSRISSSISVNCLV